MKVMTMTATPSTPAPQPTPSAVVRSAGLGKRIATLMRRRVQSAVTVILIVTGLGAWAVALVQPWVGHTGEPGLITVPTADLDADQIRAASSAEGWLPERRKPLVHNLSHNPFLAGAAAAEIDGPASQGSATETSESAPAAVPPSDADAARTPVEGMLDAVKGLRLEVTLVSPTGERWAVINGHNYREGDLIEGFRLLEIQEGKVKLEQGGVTCLLRMD